MLIQRLQTCLLALVALACQSPDPGPREIAITPRLDPNATAAPVGSPHSAGPSTSQTSIPELTDGHFSEAVVPFSVQLDPAPVPFKKRGKNYEARIGDGKDAFTWIVSGNPNTYLDLISIKDGNSVVTPLYGAEVIGAGKLPRVQSIKSDRGTLTITYVDSVTSTITAMGRSLRLEVIRAPTPRRGRTELDLGGVLAPKNAEAVSVFRVPYFDIASVAAVDLRLEDPRFLTAWFDAGFTNASNILAAYPGEKGRNGEVRFAQHAQYMNSTSGMRRPVQERVWISWSPRLEDVLPSMNRPASPARKSLGIPFYLSFNCTPFSQATANIEALASLGVQDVQIWMHQWQKDGYDKGYPNDVMPPRRQWGGLEGLQELRAAAGRAGYGFSLHHNWMFNSVGLKGKSLVGGNGQEITTREGGSFLKPIAALELVDEVEGELHDTFQTRGTFSDSLTVDIPKPDFDQDIEGWGLIRTSLGALAGVLEHLREIHGSPVAGEGSLGGGNVTWSGLVDVLPGSLFLKSSPPAKDRSGRYTEVVPHFALGPLHELSVRAGIGPPTRFTTPQRPTMSRGYTSEERDLTQTLTALYGNAGYYWWYASTRPGSCARDWWAGSGLFQVLASPGRTPSAIQYVDERGRELELPEWIAAGHSLQIGAVRLRLTWDGGDELFCNLSDEDWRPKGRKETIAPMGYLARAGGVSAAILSTKAGTVQSLESLTRRYLDGRGALVSAMGITTDGAVGLERQSEADGGGWRVFPIPEYTLSIPGKGREELIECHTIGLDTSIVGPGEYAITWLDAAGVATGAETRKGGNLALTLDDFTTRGATSITVTPLGK